MKILSVSDVVIKKLIEPEHRIEGIDLILSCGDLPPEYLAALKQRYNVPLYYILGNHDLRYKESPPLGCMDINRRILTIGPLKITGFSGSRWYNGNINQYTEKQMARFIGKLRFSLWRHKGIDLVISHAPPRFINDAEDPCHRGFRAFRRFIDKYQPHYFIHGHIHKFFKDDSTRITQVNKTSVINSYGYHVLKIEHL